MISLLLSTDNNESKVGQFEGEAYLVLGFQLVCHRPKAAGSQDTILLHTTAVTFIGRNMYIISTQHTTKHCHYGLKGNFDNKFSMSLLLVSRIGTLVAR